MSRNVFWIAALLAVTVGVLGAIGSGTRSADARIPGDICQMTAWDSNGNVIPDGGTVGGDGTVYLVFRVEDDPFGYVNDFLLDGPVQDILDELEDEIQALEDEIDALDPEDDADEIAELEAELAALLEVQAEYIEAIEGVLDTDLVQIDSSTGSARIVSKAEVVGFEWIVPNVAHILVQPGVLSQRVDHMFPSFFNDADGHELNSIRDWLVDVGVPNPGAPSDFSANVCGGSAHDGWGFVDIKCIEAGRFRVNVTPQRETSENTRGTIDMYCPGQADSAEISVSRSVVETHPVGSSASSSIVTVAVMDQSGARIDGAEVTFTTDKCKFSNPGAGVAGDSGMSPAGGGTTVTTWSDTDSTVDTNFLLNNPLQDVAGTAEVSLDCAGVSTLGVANITAIVQRQGADIVLNAEVNVVGQAAASGLSLTLTPDDLECGETILAVADAVDALGQPVSDGTVIYFTTDTSSGVQGGIEGAQGQGATVDGEASALIATDPGNPGTHTVIAYTINAAGNVNAQTSKTYVCDGGVAPVAPTVAPPAGGGSISPPNTGSAGLASGTETAGPWIAVIAAVVAVLVSGLGLTIVRSR